MITHISFDLDGTLEHGQFDKLVWNVEIPKLYAKEYRVPIEEAKRTVFAEYYKALYIEHVTNWTDIGYWFNRLGLHDYKTLLHQMKEHIHLYDDTIETLEYLSKNYSLIIISISEEKFFNLKLEATGLGKYFKHAFCANSFKLSKKDKAAFERPLHELRLPPSHLMHIGNELHADYEVPTSIGIRALLLDRSGTMDDEFVIHSLRDLKKLL